MRSANQSADADDLVENQLRKFLPKRLAGRSLVLFVKSIDAGDAGEVGDGFEVPDEDLIEGALHQSREAQIVSSSTILT